MEGDSSASLRMTGKDARNDRKESKIICTRRPWTNIIWPSGTNIFCDGAAILRIGEGL